MRPDTPRFQKIVNEPTITRSMLAESLFLGHSIQVFSHTSNTIVEGRIMSISVESGNVHSGATNCFNVGVMGFGGKTYGAFVRTID